MYGDQAVLARAGLILGPYENVGRLPYWLLRIERGGEVLAPGPPDLPLQCVDARELAAWLLDAAQGGGVSGPVNLVDPPGHTSMRTLLDGAMVTTGSHAQLVWVDDVLVAGALHAPSRNAATSANGQAAARS